MSICDIASQKAGKVVLFIGNECRHWTPKDFANAASFALSLGVDTIAPKRANGDQKWYVNAANLRLEREAVLAVGVGYLPFIYCYGPAFGEVQYQIEADTIKEICSVNDGLCCLDMETEWNGKAAEAAHFASLLQGAGMLWCSTWADPNQQNWNGVVKALAPAITVWGPQEYTRWLEGQEGQLAALGVTHIHPEFDLGKGFDAGDDPLKAVEQAIARGHKSVWLWEYQYAKQNTQLVSQIVAAMHGGGGPPPPPPPPPAPDPGGWMYYTVQGGDSLSEIESFLHLDNGWYSDLYQPNMSAIEDAARAHGHHDSNGGSLIFPGLRLRYRR